MIAPRNCDISVALTAVIYLLFNLLYSSFWQYLLPRDVFRSAKVLIICELAIIPR